MYRSAGPHVLGGQFETKFRAVYMGVRLFDLAYMRHTMLWFQLFTGQTLDECLESIESDPMVSPVEGIGMNPCHLTATKSSELRNHFFKGVKPCWRCCGY